MSSFDKRPLTAWLLSVPLSYFTVSYLENFYPPPFGIVLWSVPIHALSALLAHYLIGKSLAKFRSASAEGWIAAFLYAGLLVFIPAMYGMAKPFRNLFDAAVFHLASESWAWYAAAVLASRGLAAHDSLKTPKNLSSVFSSTGFVTRLTTTKRITPKIIAHTPL